MKVPKMYKSSERYDAGVDVIYDDDSKLEYAPFIYATTGSGDSGGDGGDDEEGEGIMVVNVNEVAEGILLDKTWQEIYDAVGEGKYVLIRQSIDLPLGEDTEYFIFHVDSVGYDPTTDPMTYVVRTHAVETSENEPIIVEYIFKSATPTDAPLFEQI